MFSFVYNDLDFAHKLDEASKPSEDYAKHMHTFCEIIYFVKGDASYTVEAQTIKLKPHDIILIQPGKFHFATVNSKIEYERYVFKFPLERLPDFLRTKLLKQESFFTNMAKYYLFFKQCDNYFTNYSDDELYTLIMTEMIKLLIIMCKQQTYSQYQSAENLTAQIINFIDENIHDHITLEMLSEHFHYSKTFLSSEFRKYMHVSLMQYVRSKKIIAAHALILSGKKKHDAAAELGFTEYSTFYRSYKQLIGNEAGKKK